MSFKLTITLVRKVKIMKKLSLILTLFVLAFLSSCKSGNDRGQLVGVSANKKFFPEKPFGMV